MEKLVNIIYKKFKRILSNLEYHYGWLRVINSPFIRLKWKFKWYNKPTIGTPYFLPRRIQKSKNKPDYLEFIPIKYFGINYWPLGWKTKWSDTDIRFEWGPGLSLVLFGTQLVIYPVPNCDVYSISDYWEAWIIYNKHTNKTKSIKERLRESMELYPAKWIKYEEDKQISTNYWNYILKNKYKCLINKQIFQKDLII